MLLLSTFSVLQVCFLWEFLVLPYLSLKKKRGQLLETFPSECIMIFLLMQSITVIPYSLARNKAKTVKLSTSEEEYLDPEVYTSSIQCFTAAWS